LVHRLEINILYNHYSGSNKDIQFLHIYNETLKIFINLKKNCCRFCDIHAEFKEFMKNFDTWQVEKLKNKLLEIHMFC